MLQVSENGSHTVSLPHLISFCYMLALVSKNCQSVVDGSVRKGTVATSAMDQDTLPVTVVKRMTKTATTVISLDISHAIVRRVVQMVVDEVAAAAVAVEEVASTAVILNSRANPKLKLPNAETEFPLTFSRGTRTLRSGVHQAPGWRRSQS